MKVLYLSPRDCWPVTTGARLRDFHLTRQLAREFEVTYAGFHGEAMGGEKNPQLGELPGVKFVLLPRPGSYSAWRLALGLMGPKPVSVLNYRTAGMRRRLEQLLREGNFDAVQVEGVHLAGYLDLLKGKRVLCDWHNIESELMDRYGEQEANYWKRVYARRTARLLEGAEREMLERCAVHTVCSERERVKLSVLVPGAVIEVIGNGVDVEYHAKCMGEEEGGGAGGGHVLFVGSMDYHANIDGAVYFAREVWPTIRERRPGMQFWIVGSRPVEAVRALGREEGIRVTGTVPDVRPYYRGVAAVVAPLRVAGGTRLKVLEAMAAGAAVVSTTIGAEGLAVSPGENILLADTNAEMADQVLRLAGDEELKERIARKGREMVSARYSWEAIGAGLRKVYRERLFA